VPVSAATGSLEGSSRNPRRHADFSTWQPPEEEGDDEPILSAGSEGQAREIDPRGRGRGRDRRPLAPPAPAPDAITMGAEPPYPAPRAIATDAARPAQADEAADAGDFAEIYVNIGRRDGARAIDFQQILTDKAGLDRAHVRRIRVRERNAFVSVKRDDLARALGALAGSSIAGKVALAEQARERSDPDTPMQDAVTLVPAPITSAIEGEVHAATRVDDDRTHPNADALRAEPAPEDDAPVTGRST
jgi:ATP-dependent RNA helicase DeaD